MTSVSEQKKQQIQKEAEIILKKFSASLQKISIPTQRTDKLKTSGMRKEGPGAATNAEFRQQMFANAPDKNEDCIIAEKKAW